MIGYAVRTYIIVPCIVFLISLQTIAFAFVPPKQVVRLAGWEGGHVPATNAASAPLSLAELHSASYVQSATYSMNDTKLNTLTYMYTGTEQLYSAPAAVKFLKVQMWGAGGGGGTIVVGEPYLSFGGGAAGYSECFIRVDDLKAFQVIVGGGGESRDTIRSSPSPGGFGGGGNGVSWGGDGQNLGGGGGRSALRYHSSTSSLPLSLDDLVTAGGGGGGGCSLYSNTENNGGGAGGGLIGLNSLSSVGGLGGSQVSGGASVSNVYGNGGAGQKYQGGETIVSSSGHGIGAGGGGGYFGGSSGASSESSYGGAGGGSSFLGGCIQDGSAFTRVGRSGGNNLYRAPAVDSNGIMPPLPNPPAIPIAGCSASALTVTCCYQYECFWGSHYNDCCCYASQSQCFDSLPLGADPYPYGYGGRAGHKGPEGNGGNGMVILTEYGTCIAGTYFSTSSERCVPCPSGWTSSAGDLVCYNFLSIIQEQIFNLTEQISQRQNKFEKIQKQLAKQAKEIDTVTSLVHELKKKLKRMNSKND